MNAIARITNHKSKEQNNENSISSRKLQKLQNYKLQIADYRKSNKSLCNEGFVIFVISAMR